MQDIRTFWDIRVFWDSNIIWDIGNFRNFGNRDIDNYFGILKISILGYENE